MVIADVTAALETWRLAAIDGSEGKKILVASVPMAANAQITAIAVGVVRSLSSDAGGVAGIS
jgi:hypothetical protein